jgi:hypothetical protein
MSSELIKNNSVCNYAMLNRYYGSSNLGNTLNQIPCAYPVAPMYQVVPMFAGTGMYNAPNYNSLCKGSCYTYAGINQAYIDCSSDNPHPLCAMTGGQCVVYKKRDCDGPAQMVPPSYYVKNGQCYADLSQMPDMKANPPRYGSVTSCLNAAAAGSGCQVPAQPVQPYPTGYKPKPTVAARK